MLACRAWRLLQQSAEVLNRRSHAICDKVAPLAGWSMGGLVGICSQTVRDTCQSVLPGPQVVLPSMACETGHVVRCKAPATKVDEPA